MCRDLAFSIAVKGAASLQEPCGGGMTLRGGLVVETRVKQSERDVGCKKGRDGISYRVRS